MKFARTSQIIALAALSITTGTTVAIAAPVTADRSSSGSQAPQFKRDVRATIINSTDLEMTYITGADKTRKAIAPGEQMVIGGGDNVSGELFYGNSRAFINAVNPTTGTPWVKAVISNDGEYVKNSEHQGEDEHDVIVESRSWKISSYRHGDTDTKNFTITLERKGSQSLGVDNTASTANAYVYRDGKMTAVRKGEKAELPALVPGKATTFDIQRRGNDTSVKVDWKHGQAVFVQPGKAPLTVADGQTAKLAGLEVSRVTDASGNHTHYTFVLR